MQRLDSACAVETSVLLSKRQLSFLTGQAYKIKGQENTGIMDSGDETIKSLVLISERHPW